MSRLKINACSQYVLPNGAPYVAGQDEMKTFFRTLTPTNLEKNAINVCFNANRLESVCCGGNLLSELKFEQKKSYCLIGCGHKRKEAIAKGEQGWRKN